jgi:integrase
MSAKAAQKKIRKRKDGILELPNGKFHAVVWTVTADDRRVKKEKSCPSLTLARQWRNSFKTDILRAEMRIGQPRITIEELVKKWLKDREKWIRDKWPDDKETWIRRRMSIYQHSLEVFMEIVKPTRPVTQIKKKDIERYIEFRQKEENKNNTINRSLTAIKQCFKAAASLFPLELKGWELPRVDLLPESKRCRQRILSYDEEARIHDELLKISQDAADFFIVAIETALRLRENAGLKRANIFLEHDQFTKHGAIVVLATKTDKPKTIPMTALVREIMIRRLAEPDRGQFIYLKKDSRSTLRGALNHIEYAIHQAAKNAGVLFGRDTANGWTIHDLRRTAINRMLIRTNFDYVTVSKVAGVSIEVLLNSYARTDAERMQRAVERSDEPLKKALNGVGDSIETEALENEPTMS